MPHTVENKTDVAWERASHGHFKPQTRLITKIAKGVILLLVALAVAWAVGYGIAKIPGAKELFAKIGANIKKIVEIDLNPFFKKDMHNFFNQGALYKGVGITLAVVLGTLVGVAAIGYFCKKSGKQHLLSQAQSNVDPDSWPVS